MRRRNYQTERLEEEKCDMEIQSIWIFYEILEREKELLWRQKKGLGEKPIEEREKIEAEIE